MVSVSSLLSLNDRQNDNVYKISKTKKKKKKEKNHRLTPD